MNPETKYTRVEYERRFLIDPEFYWKGIVESYSTLIEDRYLAGTRLRLRVMTDSDTGRRLIKLTKKSESSSPYFRTLSRILLTDVEYQLFEKLPSHRIKKTRYYCNHLSRVLSIDVFASELEGLVICETESDSLEDLMSIEIPSFTRREVTADNFFDGGNLCRLSQKDLRIKLKESPEN